MCTIVEPRVRHNSTEAQLCTLQCTRFPSADNWSVSGLTFSCPQYYLSYRMIVEPVFCQSFPLMASIAPISHAQADPTTDFQSTAPEPSGERRTGHGKIPLQMITTLRPGESPAEQFLRHRTGSQMRCPDASVRNGCHAKQFI
ncbi:hypothetical protein NQZ68_010263 [Dissostichus eleginoides]|nr:hypothetical protein NQZ68_010263 [Dissostichus eleginoides]